MRIDYNYRKIFDPLRKENELYKNMLIIMKQIYVCYGNIQSLFCKIKPACPYIDKLSSDFAAASILMQYFYIREAMPLIRIQVETISKRILQPHTKEDLGHLKLEEMKEIFNIDGDIFKYIICKVRKKYPKHHFLFKFFREIEKINLNPTSHANLRDDLLGLQNDDLLIEDYVLGGEFNDHLFPYGRNICMLFHIQFGIILLLLVGLDNIPSEIAQEIKLIHESIKNFIIKFKKQIEKYKKNII